MNGMDNNNIFEKNTNGNEPVDSNEPLFGSDTVGVDEITNNSEPVKIDEVPVNNEAAGTGFNSAAGANRSMPGMGAFEPAKSAPFYTENYVKPKKQRNSTLIQMIIVAIMSSVFTAGAIGMYFTVIVPVVQPSAKKAFNKILGKEAEESTSTNSNSNSNTPTTKVVIENASSPVAAIAKKVGPSVVGIRVTPKNEGFGGFFGNISSPTEGSGIIIRSNGYIMTNYHVISNALNGEGKVEVFLPSKKDKPYEAEIISKDYQSELAVIKINETNLPVAPLGDSDKLQVGDIAVAIGNPGGLEFMGSVSSGVISGLNRSVEVRDENGRTKKLMVIQTDASINPGNSGGALVDAEGNVIGINTLKADTMQGFEGIGFAIPINTAKVTADNLIEFKYVKGRPPRLGIMISDVTKEMSEQYNVPMGARVESVEPFSGASKAGIEPDDIITKFNGKKVQSSNDLYDLRKDLKAGDIVDVEIYRYTDRKYMTVKVKLMEDKSTN